MPILHVDKLRSGEGGEDEYKVVETTGLPPLGARTPTSRSSASPHPRVEGAEKVTGRARYAYDVRLPGQLYARVLRSPHPHARIRRIDTAQAEALPGVRAVLSVGQRAGDRLVRGQLALRPHRALRRRRGRRRRRRDRRRSPRTRCA